jgi:hypothetical protein
MALGRRHLLLELLRLLLKLLCLLWKLLHLLKVLHPKPLHRSSQVREL